LGWSIQWVVSRRACGKQAWHSTGDHDLRFWREFNLCTKNVFIKISLDLSVFLFFLFLFFLAVNLCIMSTTCVSNTTYLFQSVIGILTASLYTWLRKRKLNLYDVVLNTDSISIVIGVIWAREMIQREDGSNCILCWTQIWLRVSSTWLRATDIAQEEVQFVSWGVERRFGCERDRH
jgi:hypothetical protein